MTLYWRPSASDCLYTIYEGRVYILEEMYMHVLMKDVWHWKWNLTSWSPYDLQGHGFEMIGEL